MRNLFRNTAATLITLCASLAMHHNATAQTIATNDATINKAFDMAIKTLDKNISAEGIILAGGDYGGEWTRDCAFNCANAANLLRPEAARTSLWSVTENGKRIGHQYWDQIIWVIAAWQHYLATNDAAFLHQALSCSATTISDLERQHFNSLYGLFTGPAVFQDGIAGYDEPIFQPGNNNSYVLDHNADQIMCLSTNCVYYKAYLCLADMMWQCGKDGNAYQNKAKQLKKRIRQHFYNKAANRLFYLIDGNGKKHNYTEGLGVAFAVLYDVVSNKEAKKILSNVLITRYGIPAVYPAFPRYSAAQPGRHNVMIWPHVNMIYASACAHARVFDQFYFEINNLAKLAVDEGGFFEIYDPANGKPSGGYQCDHLWDVRHDQTWCATGFLREFITEIFGIRLTPRGLKIRPLGMNDGSKCTLRGIKFHNNTINITVTGKGNGYTPKSCRINGVKASNFVGHNGAIYENGKYRKTTGVLNIEIEL